MSRKKTLHLRKGGGCEKLFNQRKGREKGVELAIDWLLNNNCITISKQGWCLITKIPKKINSFRWPITNIGSVYGGDAEIGWRRFMQDMAISLKESREKFRLSKLRKQGALLASLEFSFAGTFKQSKIALCQPHRDAEYKQWREESGS